METKGYNKMADEMATWLRTSIVCGTGASLSSFFY